MAFQQPGSNTSPPPLLHPVPTHPMYIPEPPSTPGSPHGYQRFVGTSSPPLQQPPLQGYPNQNAPVYSTRQPQQNQYGQPPPMHQPQQGYQQHVPDFSAWGIDGATTQLGMQLGQSAVQAGQTYVQQNVRISHAHLMYKYANYVHIACLVTPRVTAEAPLQRFKFICHPQASPPRISMEAQTLVAEDKASRKWHKRVATSSRGHQLPRSLYTWCGSTAAFMVVFTDAST